MLPAAFGLLGAACGSGGPDEAASPQRSVAEYDLARDAFQKGRMREALEHVQKARELDEANADAALLGALVHLAFCAADEAGPDCRFPEAERYARAALEVDPELRDARNTLGVVLVHQKRYAEAIAVLRPLTQDILYASPEKAWGNLGWAQLLAGRHDEAIDSLRRALAAEPLFCVGHYRLGLAYEKKGELTLAREAYSKALATPSPGCERLQDAYDARARVAAKQGMRDEARADLERCREISTGTPAGRRCAAALRSVP